MTLIRILSLIAIALLIPALGIATDGTAATQHPAALSSVDTSWKQYLPAADSCSHAEYKRSHPQSFKVASACTAACQKKHDRCYSDCNIRYGNSEESETCKNPCDADKRLCRQACRG